MTCSPSCDALKLVLTKLEALERELGFQREDFRIVRTELRGQHEKLMALLDVTPALPTRLPEVG